MVGSKRVFFTIILRVIRGVYLLFNITVIAALLVSHFVLREESYRSSLYYYAFPLPIILLIVLFLSIFLYQKFRRYNLFLASLLLIIWLGRSFKIHIPEGINENDLEIVFWNASRKNSLNQAFELNKSIPNVLVMVESTKDSIESFKNQYPDYYFFLSEKEIAIFSKAPIKIIEEQASIHNSKVVNFETSNLNFYAVDVQGSQDVPRKTAVGFVDGIIGKNENTIVLGDFNAPYESKYLDRFKADFNHAFNKKGNGFRETWFWNIPLLSLDHIWVSKDLEILKTKKTGTFKSDHNMIKTFVRH